MPVETSSETTLLPFETIERRILFIRGQKVMLDAHLAELYEVPTKVLNQAVKRNIERFPGDFMFQLNRAELENWRSQFVTSNSRSKIALRRAPYAFTEQGVAMLSSVLRSDRAVQVNIAIVRAFVRLREILSTHKELAAKLEAMEQKYDKQFKVVFEALRQLMAVPTRPKRPVEFGVSADPNR